MQGIYKLYTWNKPVSRAHSVAAVLYLQFVIQVNLRVKYVLYFEISTSSSMCAVSNVALFF